MVSVEMPGCFSEEKPCTLAMPVALGSPCSGAEGWESPDSTMLCSVRRGRMLQRKVLDQKFFHCESAASGNRRQAGLTPVTSVSHS